MQVREFFDGIGAPEAIRTELNTITLGEAELSAYWQEFLTDTNGFYDTIRKKERFRLWFLKLYLLFAAERHSDYQKRGISDQIYFDTFHDIMNWEKNCERDFGEIGLNEYDWIRLHLKLQLFKIGRLQYEVIDAAEKPKMLNRREIPAGERALNLHIPQGEPLDFEDCKASLLQAYEFFDNDIKEITCHSWLLSPALPKLLEMSSNIVKFQSLFEIYDVDSKSREAEERTFDNRVEEDPALYPERSGLQRAMKTYLCGGGKVDSAFGRIREIYLLSR